jgi:hypothetical protein
VSIGQDMRDDPIHAVALEGELNPPVPMAEGSRLNSYELEIPMETVSHGGWSHYLFS